MFAMGVIDLSLTKHTKNALLAYQNIKLKRNTSENTPMNLRSQTRKL